MLLSNCLTDPAAKFLGFLYFCSSPSLALISSKSLYVIIASPSTSKCPAQSICKGILSNTFALCVISSPNSPLPLVSAWTNSPSSYVSNTVRPSNLQDMITGFPFIKRSNSSMDFVLLNESIGWLCFTFCSSDTTSYPTVCVGELLNMYPVSFSSCCNRSNNSS